MEKKRRGGKRKMSGGEGKKEEAKEDVPEELPSLPAEDEAKEGKAEKLAPDELPHIGEKKEAPPNVLDKRLYFSKLIKRLNEGTSMDEIAEEIKNTDVIATLHWNVKMTKRDEDRISVEKDIKSTISELQGLEKEWASLKMELDQKKGRFEEIEGKIRELSDKIKGKIGQREQLK